MPEEAKEKPEQPETTPRISPAPLIFISHDSRDAELAEAFSTLLRRVSAGMLKSFRSSDRKGTEGIEFGDEWYKRLMVKLESASDVVCLLTERSFQRPWILYEAGVAKGKLKKPVLGLALGIPLSKVSVGPFYQFQNCDDSEDSLTKLITQLACRIPALEPDPNVVKAQIEAFKTQVDGIVIQLREPGKEEEETPSESSTARLLEELKVIVRELPTRVQRRLSDFELPERRRKIRRYGPRFAHELLRMLPMGPEDPTAILILTSLFRDEAPWLEVIGREVYTAIHSPGHSRRERAIITFRRVMELAVRGPFEELFTDSEEDRMLFRETIHLLERTIERMPDTLGKE